MTAHQPASLRHRPPAPCPSAQAAHVRSFLERAWPRLEAWYRFYNTTQQGPVPHSYR